MASPRELLGVAVLLAALGAVLYGPYIPQGGFITDDWALAADAADSLDLLPHPADASRPISILYFQLVYSTFGLHVWIYLLWMAVLAVAVSLALFALLRRFDVPSHHAAAISALLLAFPYADSTRFWAAASPISLSILLAVAGLLLAMRGLDRRGEAAARRAPVYHAGALTFYATSVLTYELTGVALLLAGSLYLTRAPRRPALARWIADVIVVSACLAWVATAPGARQRVPFSEALRHAGEIADGAASLFVQAMVPLGAGGAILGLGLVVACAVAILGVGRLPDAGDVRTELWRWLVLATAGVTVACAGWIPIVPANLEYNPTAAGIGNRVNALAAIGIVIAVYSIIVVLVMLTVRAAKSARRVPPPRTANALCLIAATIVAIGYADRLYADQRAWSRAARNSDRVLAKVKQGVGESNPGDRIYTFDSPAFEEEGIPVLWTPIDLGSALKLLFEDRSLSGQAIIPGTSTMICGHEGVRPTGFRLQGRELSVSGPFGNVVFVDATAGIGQRIDSLSECRFALRRFGT